MSIFMFPVTSIQSASIDDESGDGSGNVLKQNIIQLLHMSHKIFFAWFDSLRPINNLSVM